MMPKIAHRKNLTPTMIEKLRPAPKGERVRVMDSQTPGVGVSVTEKGTKTFFLVAYFPGVAGASRRELGKVSNISLADAREKANAWKRLIAKGIDPADEEARQRAAEIRKQNTTFGAVAEDFIRDKLPEERKAHDIELDIRRELFPKWENKAIADITDVDVVMLLKAKKHKVSKEGKGNGIVAARNLFALVKRLFRWAIAQMEYGLAGSPCQNINITAVVGEAAGSRDRTLADDELFAFWRAARRMPFPTGPAYRLLLLTGLRLREAANAERSEFDWSKGEWTVPASRMKGKNSGKKQARDHFVPITAEIESLVKKLPELKGKFIFSTTNGRRPVYLGSKVKAELDRRMLLSLRAIAKTRNKDPSEVELKPFVNHDLRRTVRTHLSKMKISERAREAVLAHRPPAIVGTYDAHDYMDEKREALTLWAARLLAIVEPSPSSNVVSLAAALTSR